MAYIPSNYVNILIVCASAEYLQNVKTKKKRCILLRYTMYINNSQKVLP